MAKVLVVDDEPAILTLCRSMLKLRGYSVVSASGGEAALRILEEANGEIDLALVDVMMPAMNGVELAQHIQTTYPDVKIILMTGFATEEIQPLTAGQTYKIIFKPFKTESFLHMIGNVLEAGI